MTIGDHTHLTDAETGRAIKKALHEHFQTPCSRSPYVWD